MNLNVWIQLVKVLSTLTSKKLLLVPQPFVPMVNNIDSYLKMKLDWIIINVHMFHPWLAIRLEFLGAVIIFGAAIFAVIGVIHDTTSISVIDTGVVGLSVSYALSVTNALKLVIRAYCEIEVYYNIILFP